MGFEQLQKNLDDTVMQESVCASGCNLQHTFFTLPYFIDSSYIFLMPFFSGAILNLLYTHCLHVCGSVR